jgi:hypothetical protein
MYEDTRSNLVLDRFITKSVHQDKQGICSFQLTVQIRDEISWQEKSQSRP